MCAGSSTLTLSFLALLRDCFGKETPESRRRHQPSVSDQISSVRQRSEQKLLQWNLWSTVPAYRRNNQQRHPLHHVSHHSGHHRDDPRHQNLSFWLGTPVLGPLGFQRRRHLCLRVHVSRCQSRALLKQKSRWFSWWSVPLREGGLQHSSLPLLQRQPGGYVCCLF